MPRTAILKPAFREARDKQGLAAWAVNVPANLSPTGRRQELFFSTKADAKVECEKLKARKDNFGSSLTAMTPARIAEAAEAFKILDPINVDLLTAVRGYVKSHKARSASIPFLKLFNLYLDAKQDRNPRYLQELRITRDRMPQLHTKLVCDISYRDLEPILNGMTPGARNPVMRYLRAVFFYGIKRGYLTENPIARLDFAERPRREVETIPADQVSKMLNHALETDLELLPFLVCGFFCGIRPDGELQKLEWRDIDFSDSDSAVVIRPEVSKTNRRRFIDLSDNAKAWLKTYVGRGGTLAGRIVPFNYSQLRTHRKANREAAGITQWPKQGMRHTYCSNWLAKHGDINKLVLQSGHDSVDTMWRHYHRGTTKAEADKFWNIRPPTVAGNIVPMAKAS